MASRTSLVLPVTLGLALVVAACGTTPSGAPDPSGSPGGAATASPGSSAASSAVPSPSDGTGAQPSASPFGPVGPLPCVAPAAATPAQTEGPYFTAGSPERNDLTEPGMAGTQLLLVAAVVTTDCSPVENAVVDVWQADAAGVYDNTGYRLRGHVRTDGAGRLEIRTIVPGQYPGRTEHIHVKVTPPGGSTLTTQLYFPGEPNTSDGIFDPGLVLDIAEGTEGLVGTFTFVLPAD